MILNDSCVQCLVALVAACAYKVIVKVAAGEMFIYCILPTKIHERELVGGFYGDKKIEVNGELGDMLIYSFSSLIPFGGIGWP